MALDGISGHGFDGEAEAVRWFDEGLLRQEGDEVVLTDKGRAWLDDNRDAFDA